MKLWFVEPRANIFVSGVKDSVAKTVVNYLHKHCPAEAGIVMFRSISEPPGFEIHTIGSTRKSLIEISGLQLVIETLKQI